jgi:hypothetical protein
MSEPADEIAELVGGQRSVIQPYLSASSAS